MNVTCQYCGKQATFINSSYIYGKSYGMIYYCKDCDAYVGVHKGTDKPLGILANAELRGWKKRAHFYFDRLWKDKIMTRKAAYKWLSKQLNKNSSETHIGMFGISDCKRVVDAVFKYWREQS
jgi:hypothetical protein